MGLGTSTRATPGSGAFSTLVPTVLAPAERLTLSWVCGALFPRLEPSQGDDPALFSADALAVGVPAAVEEALASVPREQANDFRLLLRALDNALFMVALVGKAHSFRALTAGDRERALLAMSTSALPLARKGFQALKRLTSFLFYSVMDERRANPTWHGIGYTPSENAPPRESALRLTTVTAPVHLECDVCVVGSGAGGGVVAADLAAAGFRVIVLEQGPGDQSPDFDQREIVGMQRLYLDRGMTSTRDLGVAVLAGGCVGGGTTVNWQTSIPLPDEIRSEWTAESGCHFFVEESFTRALESVGDRLGVGAGESAINENNAALRRGCEKLRWSWRTVPRNARGCDVAQCGYCVFGCRHGGKQSTAVTYLADAQRTGDVTIVPNCRALHVTYSRSTVTGVLAVARDADSAMGTEFKVDVHCRVVVIAAGGLATPALLLRSRVAHSAIGRNLYLHPTSAVAGVYANAVRPWSGPPQTVMSDEYAKLDGNYGVRLETAPGHPGLLALAQPWFGARDHRERMQRAANLSATIVLARDRSGGRVSVRREGHAAMDYRPGVRELAHLRRGLAAAVRAHVAAGAEEVLTLHSRPHVLRARGASAGAVEDFCERILKEAIDRNWSTLFSAHQMGTCRMGADRRTCVCDEDGRVAGVHGLYVADASLFPASSGVNPMITVMALARHVAARVASGAGSGKRVARP
jgi:choline dehydrogenase-like flavoprotein